MAILNQSAVYNEQTQTIYPVSTSTWSGLASTTWEAWTNWAYSTNDTIVYHSQVTPLGFVAKDFTLTIETESNAEISYKVYTSMTGDFSGEETETDIPSGATNVASFNGRFFFVTIIATRVFEMPVITGVEITLNETADEIVLSSVSTSTLGGTQTARQIPLPRPISRIVDVKIMPHETASPYNLDVYVTNTPTSTYLIPKIISKSNTTPTFALVGVDNQPRDGVVDIRLKTLPEQYMLGNNLYIR
jgi:hypothetical protein